MQVDALDFRVVGGDYQSEVTLTCKIDGQLRAVSQTLWGNHKTDEDALRHCAKSLCLRMAKEVFAEALMMNIESRPLELASKDPAKRVFAKLILAMDN